MNIKIALSGLSIVAAVTMLGGAAFAAFTATATAASNTFSTTNPNLEVSVNSQAFGTSVTGATLNGLIPGTPGTPQSFVLENTDNDTGADLATTLQLTPSNTNTLPGGDLTIVVNCGAGDISDSYSNWISTPHSIGTVNHGDTLSCTMTPTLNSGVGNGDAGKSAIFDATFTGTVGS